MTGARLQAIGYRRRNALTEFNANRLDHRDALSATRTANTGYAAAG